MNVLPGTKPRCNYEVVMWIGSCVKRKHVTIIHFFSANEKNVEKRWLNPSKTFSFIIDGFVSARPARQSMGGFVVPCEYVNSCNHPSARCTHG